MRQILTKDKNFKMLFGSYENIDILESFLSGILSIPMDEIKGNVKFVKNELDEEIGVVRQSVDVLINLPNRMIHLEMNPTNQGWTKRRNFIYGARIYENQFTKSDDYKKKVNYIQLNLNGYEEESITKEQDIYYLMTEEGKKWIEDFEIREINIPFCLKMWYDGDRRDQVRWTSIFGCKDKSEFKKIVGEGLMKKETKEKLEKCVDQITEENPVWWDYEKDEQMIINSLKSDAREEGFAEGQAKGLAEGLAEGKKEANIENARKMKQSGMSTDDIIKFTSLTLEEIEAL